MSWIWPERAWLGLREGSEQCGLPVTVPTLPWPRRSQAQTPLWGPYNMCVGQTAFPKGGCDSPYHLTCFSYHVTLTLLLSTDQKKCKSRDFAGGPVVKTLHFQGRGRGFNTWSGNKELRSHMLHDMVKEKWLERPLKNNFWLELNLRTNMKCNQSLSTEMFMQGYL